jgi:peroxiredoxin
MMKNFTLIFPIVISLATSAQTIQNFSLTNAADGKTISLNSYASYAGVVIIFTSNECPFDQYYVDRILALHEDYSSNVPVILINSHIDEKETVAAMKDYARQCNLTMPYLADKNQQVLSQFTARKSPEAFLLKNTSGKFSVAYRGAIDDNAQTAAEVREPYLRNAIEQMVAGQKIEMNDVRPAGCSIRKN